MEACTQKIKNEIGRNLTMGRFVEEGKDMYLDLSSS